jgi:hypothetical protein
VDSYAEKNQIAWLLAHRVPVTCIEKVDTETGAMTGRLRTFPGLAPGGMRISPDGSHLAVCDQASAIRWVSTASGGIDASTKGGAYSPTGGNHVDCFAGFDGPEDDPWVFYSACERATAVSRLYRWRPRTGEQRVVIEEPAYVMTYNNGTRGAVSRRYGLVHRSDGTATLSAPDFIQAYHEHRYPITIRSPEQSGGAIERTIDVADPFVCTSHLTISSRSPTVFLCAGTTGILGFDLNTGDRLGTVRPALPETPTEELEISANGERLFLPVFKNAILVRDTVRESWLARLVYPSQFIAPGVSASPDGRWLAAIPFVATGNTYKHELFLFDLQPLNGKPQTEP